MVSFVENCLFTTLTNVNFDPEVHVKLLQEAQKIKDELRQQIGGTGTENIYMAYRLPETKSEMLPVLCMTRIWMKISVLSVSW